MKVCKPFLILFLVFIVQDASSVSPVPSEGVAGSAPNRKCAPREIDVGANASEQAAVAKRNDDDTETEISCWDSGRLYYNGSCYRPASQGPCQESEWLILVQDQRTSSARVSCQKRPCFKEEIPVSGGLCVSRTIGRNSICGEKEVLVINPYGQGICICQTNPVHLEWSEDRKCYELYRRGPCEFSEYLIVSPKPSENAATLCAPNNCTLDGFVWFQGKCRELGATCPGTALEVNVDESTLQLDCVEANRDIFPRVPPCSSSSPYRYSSFCRGSFFSRGRAEPDI